MKETLPKYQHVFFLQKKHQQWNLSTKKKSKIKATMEIVYSGKNLQWKLSTVEKIYK